MDPKLDAADFRLLELLQEDARMPMAKLAELVDLSEPACYRRIQRLKRDRVIEREVAVIAPRTMGWPLTMIVLVTLERERTAILDQFIRKLQSVPEIVDAWYVTGDYDFALRIVARDMESFERMTRDVLYADNFVKNFKTLVTMRSVKVQAPLKAAAPDDDVTE
ncbi:Lrp/AsnC family transcriptional regulator [Steroidobacter sp.]|uniref:Lrp/AsnC family transcriptional regulator n=1 Tax=Steroidobacter sp. TaxID=1978227 RepID=UPI001A5ED30B|nr:Lrp/AsnC family transcriptional regulator [Steroidobacter sp.]MBL8266530.1 Lrp/AsnC family transcriptional regulator [Steroidobacter sp.]